MRRISRAEQEHLDAVSVLEKRLREKRRDQSGQRRRDRKSKIRNWYRQVYLTSPHWKRFSAYAVRSAGAKCSVCGSKQKLRVHHLHYSSLWKERLSDVQVLCNGCHENAHEGDKPGVFDPVTKEYLQIFR